MLSGGTAENPVVLASSTEILLSGGSTITGTIDGGSLVVSSGGSESVLPAGGSGSIAGSNSIAAGGALTILGGPAVDAGGTLTIASGGVVTNAGELVIGGGAGGEIVSSAGQNLFLPNGGGGELTIGSGGTLTDSGTLTVEAGDPGISGGPNGGDGTLTDGGTLTIAGGGTLIDAGTVIIAPGGLLDVQSGGVVDGGIDFSGAGGTLQIDSAPPFARLTFSSTLLEDAVVSGFPPGDTIDLTSVAYDSADQVTSASNELQIMADDGTFGLALDPAQNFAGDTFVFGLNSGSGTLITEEATPCYCRGTRILTDRGEVPVEELAIGDLVMTQDGWLRPIKWIGTRSYDGRFIRGNREVLPIVITAGSLDEGVPARDLWVSPEHALYIDRLLVPAKLLVNGMTITQAKVVERLEYFHLEFAEHEIILAECAPAESYVEIDNRWSFHNAEEYARLHPEDDRPSTRECAPRLAPGMQELSDIRKKMFTRAVALGSATTDDPDLHLIADGVMIQPISVERDRYRFVLDAKPAELWLASRSAVPTELELLSTDRRRLGVCTRCITLRDADFSFELLPGNPHLAAGFHENEGAHRWTDGMAPLPAKVLALFPGPLDIDIALSPSELRYPRDVPFTIMPSEEFGFSATIPEQTRYHAAAR